MHLCCNRNPHLVQRQLVMEHKLMPRGTGWIHDITNYAQPKATHMLVRSCML